MFAYLPEWATRKFSFQGSSLELPQFKFITCFSKMHYLPCQNKLIPFVINSFQVTGSCNLVILVWFGSVLNLKIILNLHSESQYCENFISHWKTKIMLMFCIIISLPPDNLVSKDYKLVRSFPVFQDTCGTLV